MAVIDEADPASKAAARKARIRRMARTRRMALVHLQLAERGRANAPGKDHELTVDEKIALYEQQIALIKLAAVVGIDALRQWLNDLPNDLERRIKPKRGRAHGSGYEIIDQRLIWKAYEMWRLTDPPIMPHEAITRLVEAYYASNKIGGGTKKSIGGGTKQSIIKRLMQRDWPPDAGSGRRRGVPRVQNK
jgi:hypothetical protein